MPEFLGGWWSWEPPRRSCFQCGWCRDGADGAVRLALSSWDVVVRVNDQLKHSASNAPGDGHIYPKHVEPRIHQ